LLPALRGLLAERGVDIGAWDDLDRPRG
jgi:hypothetical protein